MIKSSNFDVSLLKPFMRVRQAGGAFGIVCFSPDGSKWWSGGYTSGGGTWNSSNEFNDDDTHHYVAVYEPPRHEHLYFNPNNVGDCIWEYIEPKFCNASVGSDFLRCGEKYKKIEPLFMGEFPFNAVRYCDNMLVFVPENSFITMV